MDARKCAASYLSARPRTEKQLRDHLARKGCGKEDIRETVAELKEYGYIDDREYCRMYFEYGFEKKRGTGRIIRELKDRGVSSDVIECVYSSLEYVPDQYEAAMSAAVEGAPRRMKRRSRRCHMKKGEGLRQGREGGWLRGVSRRTWYTG